MTRADDVGASREPALFPERIGKYDLLLPLGAGGMGCVYLGRTHGIGGFHRDVAVKLIHAHLRAEDAKLQLLDEARLAARIRHPNVVPVLEVGDDPYGTYLVMDYVHGVSLGELLRAGRAAKDPLPLRLVARILSDALAGLHAAHEAADDEGRPLGIVHRDVSPSNLLIDVEGVTRLADFGVAKGADRAVRTHSGLVKGKVAYMAPEQARGHAIDRRCDVWAAGVVAWELVARQRMHSDKDEVATLLAVVTSRPPALESVVPDVQPALASAVARALEPNPAARFATASELRHALEDAWRKGDGIADAEELAQYVQRLLRSRLDERRARAAEVQRLRARVGEVAQTRNAPEARTDPSAAATVSVDEDPTVIDGPRAEVTSSGASDPTPAPLVEPTRHARRRSVGVGIASGLLGAALVALIAAVGTNGGARGRRAGPVSVAPPPVPASHEPIASAEPPAAALSAPPASATAPPPVTAARRPDPRRAVPASPAAARSASPLARNPYGTPR